MRLYLISVQGLRSVFFKLMMMLRSRIDHVIIVLSFHPALANLLMIHLSNIHFTRFYYGMNLLQNLQATSSTLNFISGALWPLDADDFDEGWI
jgi:hypothetical protein